jgi:hypothetical protein
MITISRGRALYADANAAGIGQTSNTRASQRGNLIVELVYMTTLAPKRCGTCNLPIYQAYAKARQWETRRDEVHPLNSEVHHLY